LSVTWQTLDLSSLISSEIVDITESAQSVITILSTLVDTVATALELVALLTLAEIDLLRTAVEVLIAAIDAAIALYTDTTVGVIYYLPTNYKKSLTVPRLLSLVSQSFDDRTDPARPTGDDEGNNFLFWLVVGVDVNIKSLIEKFNALLELFGRPFPNLDIDTDSFFAEAESYPPPTEPGQGQAPDWESFRLADLEPFSVAVNALLSLRAQLAKDLNSVDQLRARIELIQRRLAEIEALIQEILDLLSRILAAIDAAGGLNVLSLYGQGSIDTQQQALLTATSRPSYPFANVSNIEVAGCFGLHLQSGTGGAIEVLRTLLGVKDSAQEFIDNRIDAPISQASQTIDANNTVIETEAQRFRE